MRSEVTVVMIGAMPVAAFAAVATASTPAMSPGTGAVYFHGGESPGYNSKIAYDPANQMTLVVWSNMAVALDGQQPANTLMVKVLDHAYQQSPLSTGH